MSNDEAYVRERAEAFLQALSDLWSATDYPEWQDVATYSEQELKAILGQWIHVRKACDVMFARIRESHPELPGWDPIQGDRSIEQRLADG